MKMIYWGLLATLLPMLFACAGEHRRMPADLRKPYLAWHADSLAAAEVGKRAEPRNALYLIRAIRPWVANHPRAPMAEELAFYAAHLYEAALQDTTRAVAEYLRVVEDYPKSREAEEALYRAGDRYHHQLRDTSEALLAYERYRRRYAASPRLREVERRKATLLQALQQKAP